MLNRRFQFGHHSLPALLVVLGTPLGAQTISSTVIGTAVDPTGAAVPKAETTLRNAVTGEFRTSASEMSGLFRFSELLPGTYSLTIRATGFKAYTQTAIQVTANETRDLGTLKLTIGSLNESIEVTAETTPVQSASSEKSALVSGTQLNQIALKGRDLLGMMDLLPGVIDTSSTSRNAPTTSALLGGLHINGARTSQMNFTVDGINDMDTASNNTVHYEPNMDAIAEVRVLTSNYQAEFGRGSGGVVTVVTKGGTPEFHGSGYWSNRNEQFNANDFFSNRTGLPRAPYRFNIAGYGIGGPVYIPKRFNRDRNKLFFFVSEEWSEQRQSFGTHFVEMPTAAERQGDFSHSLDASGRLIPAIDPLTGAAFPGNVIPASRVNATGQTMVKFLPLPNYVDPSPQLVNQQNYRVNGVGPHPRRDDVIRIDANPTDKMRVFWSYVNDLDQQDAPFGLFTNGNVNYNLTPVRLGRPGNGNSVHVTNVLTPTLVNEFIFGRSFSHLTGDPVNTAAVDRSLMGNPPRLNPLNPQSDEANYIPNVTFGGTPVNAPVVQLGPLPYLSFNTLYSFADDISKVWRRHNFKVGIYVEHTDKLASVQGTNAQYRGLYSFARDANNPFDSGDSFANALLGNFDTYTETSGRANANYYFWNAEWYVQDNWRVSSRLTIDAGLRFYHLTPIHDTIRTIAGFDPAAYSLGKSPRLYYPGKDAHGTRVAVDPVTGATAPAALIGQFVPGTGNPANGMMVAGQNGYPPGLMTFHPLFLAPRLGFAYDLTGKSKTVLRGGFGMYNDRPANVTLAENLAGTPPITYTPTLYYGNLATFSSAAGYLGPTSVTYPYGNTRPAATMNYSLGLQQNVGFGTVVDVSYVGMLARHLLWARNINPIPMFARFNPANADPTTPSKPLPDNFLRPYQGYGDLNQLEFAATANYNALQVSVQRRFKSHLMFGGAYSWSKTLTTTSGDAGAISPYFSPRLRNYGPADFDICQALTINYVYEIPNFKPSFGGRPLSLLVNGWSLSGVLSFISGTPVTPGFTNTTATDLTGSTEGARITVVGDPNALSSRSFYKNFNTAAFALTPLGSFGNAGVNILRLPGINNWDLAIGRKIPLGLGEKRTVDFRAELYNAWNHTQFSGLDTAARFDPNGNQINGDFGAYTAARPPRIIALTLRLHF